MRVESYVRDYDTSGYKIVGKDCGRIHEFSPRHCQTLEVEFYAEHGMRIETDEQWEKYIFPYVDSELFRDTTIEPEQRDQFVSNYKSILRGHVPGWEITEIEVSPTAVLFDFYHIETGMYGFLGIYNVADIHLKVKGPKLSSGVRPKYRIWPNNNQTSEIYEDMGYRARYIRLRIKDPKKYDNLLHRWSILADITEYESI